MKTHLKQIFIGLFLILSFSISSFAKDSVTMYLDEVEIDNKELKLSIYGSAESEDFDSHKWQIVNIEVIDLKSNTLDFEVESDKRGFWEIEDIDITSLSDGELLINATMVNEKNQELGLISDKNTIKDTSFKLDEYLKEHLAISIFLLMVVLLLSGFPMMIPLIAGTTLGIYLLFDGDFSKMEFLIQQMMGGIRPAALIAVPMFILSADIMTRGKSAEKLIDLVMAFVRHIKGGLAVSTAGACAMFGAVSGSTQATVVAIGSPLRPRLKKGGYKDSFILALIVNSSDIAFLIPPSIGMIIYGIVAKTSIPELFIAGIGPGLLILFLFSIYSIIYAYRHNIPTEPKATWKERWMALYKALWPLGFPFIIVGGIFGGIFSPTEAAAVSVAYAIFLEGVVFKTMKLKDLYATAKSTGLVTGVVFILVGAGAGFAWVLSFAQVPQEILDAIGITSMSSYQVLFVISIAFFVGCMFVDPIVVILVLVPIFAPVVNSVGLDPVLVGTLITLQVAIGSATPPFGCDIFTAIAVFKRPYIEVIKGTPPFIVILLSVSVALIFVPEIALFLRDLAFRDATAFELIQNMFGLTPQATN
ncbi:TRAP transporter large permease [uncultured Arcobacter sp.]|uniref:TRAP transporter large permease n=1 Tax=uncultured Arcobacter sp. TaxID=165434 RepID=UPI0026301FF9|nr:TRAP transporter large permease [uncultured Arcobacter sp.]